MNIYANTKRHGANFFWNIDDSVQVSIRKTKDGQQTNAAFSTRTVRNRGSYVEEE